MAYVTDSDIEERLGNATYVQLTDDDGDGNADVGVVDEARLGAEGEVNSYLAKRFQVPIDVDTHAEVSDVLASVTLDLVEYRLRGRRPPISDAARRKRNEAIDWLTKVAAGVIDLPSSDSIAENSVRGTLGLVSGEDRLLSHDELSDHCLRTAQRSRRRSRTW